MSIDLTDIWITDQQVRLCATALNVLQRVNAREIRAARRDLTWLIVDAVDNLGYLTAPTRCQLDSIESDYWGLAGFSEFGERLAKTKERQSSHSDVLLQGHAITLLIQRHISLTEFIKWAIRVSPRGNGSEGVWTRRYWVALRGTVARDAVHADNLLQQSREGATIDQRIAALNKLHTLEIHDILADSADAPASAWRSVCLALLSQQFCWPLLGADLGGIRFGLSLPVALSVLPQSEARGTNDVRFSCEFGGLRARYVPGRLRESGQPIVDRFSQGSLTWTRDFFRSFVTALRVGKELWRSQHTRTSEHEIEDARRRYLRVDWWFANRIATLPVSIFSDFKLEGRSAEVYFAQVVLAQLLSAQTPTGVATGSIDLSQGALPLGWVDDIIYKTQYARLAGIFPRQILPISAKTRLGEELRQLLEVDQNAARVEVNYCPTARSAADAMQRAGWRRAIFVRAPEERYAFYEALGRLHRYAVEQGLIVDSELDVEPELESRVGQLAPMEKWKIDRLKCQTKDWIREGTVGVRWFEVNPVDCRPKSLSQWLAWLDHCTRIDKHEQTGPGLGIVLLRLGSGDNEMRVWARLFETLDVHPDLWKLFQWGTVTQARSVLARVLNNFLCNPLVSITPPPDLLVLVDEGGATRQRTNKVFPEDFRGQMRDIFTPELGSMLDVRDDARERVVGRTRILILQPEDSSPRTRSIEAPPVTEPVDLDERERDIVRELAVFRAGFSVQAATAIIRVCENTLPVSQARRDLEKLITKRVLGRHRGEYYIRWDYSAKLRSVRASPEAHYNAARALAPIIDATHDFVADNRDNLFDGWAIHEALWHLREAYLSSWPRQSTLRRKISEASLSLLSLMPTPDWDLVRPVMGTGSKGVVEALELATTLLKAEGDVRAESSASVHSSRYALAINVVGKRISGEKDAATLDSLLSVADRWFAAGLESVDDDTSGAQAVKLFSEFAYCLRSASMLDPQRRKCLSYVESELDKALNKYWENNLDKGDVPMSRDYARVRVLDISRPVLDRLKDARIACELWGNRDLDSNNRWLEPWGWLLGLMEPSVVDANEIANVISLMNESGTTGDRILEIARSLRLSAYRSELRNQGCVAAASLCKWLILAEDCRLFGRKGEFAWTFVEEWISESHHCFDFAHSVETTVLVEALKHLRRSLLRHSHDFNMARLAAVIFKDSWGCWSLLSRLQSGEGTNLSADERCTLAVSLAALAPSLYFESGLSMGGRGADVITERGIPAKYFQARKLSLEWLRSLKGTAKRPWERRAIEQLLYRLSPLSLSATVPTDQVGYGASA